MENIFNSGMMVSSTQHLATIIRKSLISVFQDFFASINKAFGLVGVGDGGRGGEGGGESALGYHSMGFRHFPDVS